MDQEPNRNEADMPGGTVVKEVLGAWVVFTTTSPDGAIRRVGFPKRPILEEKDLRESLESDELYVHQAS